MTFSLSICKAIVISVSFFFLFRISVSSFVAFWNALIPWKNVDGQKSINKRIVKIPTLLSMRSVCHFVPFLCISLSFKKKKNRSRLLFHSCLLCTHSPNLSQFGRGEDKPRNGETRRKSTRNMHGHTTHEDRRRESSQVFHRFYCD